MAASKRIMLVFPVGDPLQMPMLRGISQYARLRRWVLQFNPETTRLSLRDLRAWRGDGLIAFVRTTAEAAAVRALKLPAVNLSGALRYAKVPRVMVDQEAMGQLAADHLMACGLKHFAYLGEREMWYSQQRKRGFVRRLKQRGHDCRVLETTTGRRTATRWHAWVDVIEKHLRAIEPPVGLLAVHDYAGAVVIDVCQRIGLRVPEDVAILGVGDDRITCEFCGVPLSSISRSNQEVGYRAALLLDRLMAGRRPPREDILIPPEDVVKRRSTDVTAVADVLVSAAMRHIQAHLSFPLRISSLGPILETSQRTLGLHFKQVLGCTPRDYLNHARVERAKTMLAGRPPLKLQQVANSCGFSSLRHFHAAFRRVTGKPPDRHRQELPGWEDNRQ